MLMQAAPIRPAPEDLNASAVPTAPSCLGASTRVADTVGDIDTDSENGHTEGHKPEHLPMVPTAFWFKMLASEFFVIHIRLVSHACSTLPAIVVAHSSSKCVSTIIHNILQPHFQSQQHTCLHAHKEG